MNTWKVITSGLILIFCYETRFCLAGELSGASWVAKFPGSKKVEDLEDSFEGKVKQFKSMVETAGAAIDVTSTLRPKERAYLMHWSWKIVKEGFNANMVDSMPGVDIIWWHGDAATSKQKAQEMVDGYGINNLQVAPALNSRHIEGKAIDMSVTWTGTLMAKKKDGSVVSISSTPRDSTNADLISVAATYEVIHFTEVNKDKTHWSTDGH